jgi:hypothetical protein
VCASSLYSQNTKEWVCSDCGYREPRSDSFVMAYQTVQVGYDRSAHVLRKDRPIIEVSYGFFSEFYELRKTDKQAALGYLQDSYFAQTDHLNRCYLIAKLAVEMQQQETAKKYLRYCVNLKSKAKSPERVDELKQLYEVTFG